jgi:hypothetical protein
MHPGGRALPHASLHDLARGTESHKSSNKLEDQKYGGGHRASHLQLGVAFALWVSKGKDPTHVRALALVRVAMVCCVAVFSCDPSAPVPKISALGDDDYGLLSKNKKHLNGEKYSSNSNVNPHLHGGRCVRFYGRKVRWWSQKKIWVEFMML